MFDSSTFLIGKLEGLYLEKNKKWAEADADCKRLKEESYIANLLHLLRRLQYILYQVLVHRSLTHLDEFALHWQSYWQQQKKLGEDWFTEWPSGHRPLSTTWPWNIRPSLIVLWGVCWMFYPAKQNNEQTPRSPAAQQLVDGSINWMPSNFTGEEMEQGMSGFRSGRDRPIRLTDITAKRLELAIDTSSGLIAQTSTVQARSRSSPSMMQAAMAQNPNVASARPLSAGAQPHSPNLSPYQRRPVYQGESQPRSLNSNLGAHP
jgi:hypothetical protein